MYHQSVRAGYRAGGSRGRARGPAGKRNSREQVRLAQLLVCLALFLTVFIGKGVFPGRMAQVRGQLLDMIGCDVDFRAAFARLGASLAGEESIAGGLGEFFVEVFGPQEEDAAPVLSQVETLDRREAAFLNSSPGQAAAAAHYLRLDEVPEEWFAPSQQLKTPAQDPEQTAVPAVGTVLLSPDYTGPEPPEGYTMDQLSLGDLETVTPVLGTLWSEYGYREHPLDGEYKFHAGVDLGADYGREIAAFADGVVEYIGESDIYGNYFQIDHGNGVKSFYAHCSALLVQSGQSVSAGETVALVGDTGNATGPHLHFELKCNGQHVSPQYYIQYKLPQT